MTTSHLLLERIGALIHQSVREDASEHGLLPIHVQVLSYLANANHYSDIPIAVAEFFGITRGTLSQSLQVLEKKRLISRTPDPKDKRRVHLRLTAAGRRIVNQSWARRVDDALSQSSEPGESLEASLKALLRNLQRLNGQQAFGICHTCVHFQERSRGGQCGLTQEPLATDQTLKLCREWKAA